jgi:uncharacterized protein
MYVLTVETFAPMLRRLALILDKSDKFANDRSIDSGGWATVSLAPDMYPLAWQVQLACDHAMDTVARLSNQEPLPFDKSAATFEQLRTRVRNTLDFIENVGPGAFDGAEDRDVRRPLLNNRELDLNGLAYVCNWALPQFYFHLVTAYGILRSVGVNLGKRDYLTNIWGAVRQVEA